MISTRIFRSRPPWTPHQKRSRSSRSMKPCSFGETRWKLELGRLLENDGNGCMTLKKICYKIAFVCHSCQWIHHDVEDFNDGKWNDWTTKKKVAWKSSQPDSAGNTCMGCCFLDLFWRPVNLRFSQMLESTLNWMAENLLVKLTPWKGWKDWGQAGLSMNFTMLCLLPTLLLFMQWA